MERIEELRLGCFLSSSNRRRLELTKAISSPEKKAEKSSVNKIKVKLSKIDFLLIYLQSLCKGTKLSINTIQKIIITMNGNKS